MGGSCEASALRCPAPFTPCPEQMPLPAGHVDSVDRLGLSTRAVNRSQCGVYPREQLGLWAWLPHPPLLRSGSAVAS